MKSVPEQAISLIKRFEGLKLTSYKDSAGVLTVGYGHTGKDVYDGQTITRDQAEEFLMSDAQNACNQVLKLVNGDLNDNELSALTDFVFNLGIGNFKKSQLLKAINQGMHDQVPIQLMRWVYVGGEVSGWQTQRRKVECALWNSPTGSYNV